MEQACQKALSLVAFCQQMKDQVVKVRMKTC
jgi:hypothetical protein